MSRQTIHGPVGQLAAGDIHNHHQVAPQPLMPPDDPAVAECCPQCGRRTWRYSRYCIHCALDLGAWRWMQRLPLVRRRLKRVAVGLLGAGGCTALFAATSSHAIVRPIAWGVAGMLTIFALVFWMDSFTAHLRRPPADQLPLH